MQFLIVEKNPNRRKTIRHILNQKYSTILECKNEQQAYRLYKDKSIDWILLRFKAKEFDDVTRIRFIKKTFPSSKVLSIKELENNDVVKITEHIGAKTYSREDDLTKLNKSF